MSTNKHISLKVKFFVAPLNSTNVILGNDVLSTKKATINLHQNTPPLKGIAGKVHISCTIPKDVSPFPARVKMTCSTAPQHIATIPIEIGEAPEAALYMLEPKNDAEVPLMIARSVAYANAAEHVAQVMNTSDTPITLYEGHVIANLAPILERQKGQAKFVAHVISLNVDRDEDYEFLGTLEQFNINPELSKEERDLMIRVLYENRLAFAYDSRKLGQTDLVKMTLDTGDAASISSPPYHASPNG
jgi:hypothetical protein